MRRCDRVTTTTPALAESVRFLNRDVRILPNMLPDEMWPVPAKREHRAVVIGWAGSPTHHEDIRLLAGVVETVVMRHPEVSFAFVGMKPPFNEHRRIVSLPPVATDGYAALISRFDIGLAPVVQTRFNAAKSDLKYLEYAAVGIPTIASAGPTYASLEHGVTGYRAGSPAEWLKAIEKLLDRPRREMMGAAARTYAESRFMSANVRLWEEAYGL